MRLSNTTFKSVGDMYAKARRREAKILKTERERAAQPASERSQAKALLREKALDQIQLDKLNGLEHGATCHAKYREAMAKAAKEPKPNHRSKRRKPVRDAGSYRGARKNDERGTRMSHVLRAKRRALGMSRKQYDRHLNEAMLTALSEIEVAA